MKTIETYPQWICRSCGIKHGRKKTTGIISTWHNGTCDICNAKREVTEPRDFGHLKETWRDDDTDTADT